jgi:hypothetical protein
MFKNFKKIIKAAPESSIEAYAAMKNFDYNNQHDLKRHNLVRVGDFIHLGRSNSYEIYSEKTGII